jgi:hypothetical protein
MIKTFNLLLVFVFSFSIFAQTKDFKIIFNEKATNINSLLETQTKDKDKRPDIEAFKEIARQFYQIKEFAEENKKSLTSNNVSVILDLQDKLKKLFLKVYPDYYRDFDKLLEDADKNINETKKMIDDPSNTGSILDMLEKTDTSVKTANKFSNDYYISGFDPGKALELSIKINELIKRYNLLFEKYKVVLNSFSY